MTVNAQLKAGGYWRCSSSAADHEVKMCAPKRKLEGGGEGGQCKTGKGKESSKGTLSGKVPALASLILQKTRV